MKTEYTADGTQIRILTARTLEVRTEYTTFQLFARLKAMGEARNGFLTELLGKFQSKGAWSEGQECWVAFYVMQWEAGKVSATGQPEKLERVELGDLTRMVAFFEQAKTKWPQVTFVLDDVDSQAEEPEFVLSISRAGKKFPSCWNASNGRKFRDPENVWHGRIHTEDATNAWLEKDPAAKPWIADAIRLFAKDPAEFVKSYGRRTGRCCFCGCPLNDEKNIGPRLGYGSGCGPKYGLPYNMTEARKFAPDPEVQRVGV